MSSTTTEDRKCDTPTSGGLDDESIGSLMEYIEARSRHCPWKGRSFIIRCPLTGLAIGLQRGILRLVPEDSEYVGGIHWSCVESDERLLGFQNVVSGTFLGRNNRGEFIAEAKLHRDYESFCVRQHPNGGYVLLVNRGSGFLPMRRDGVKLVVGTNKDEGIAWDFSRVGQDHDI